MIKLIFLLFVVSVTAYRESQSYKEFDHSSRQLVKTLYDDLNNLESNEYEKFFGSLLDQSTRRSIQKRFLGKFFNKLFDKKNKTTKPMDYDDEFSELGFLTSTRSTTKGKFTIDPKVVTTTKSSTEPDDVFYKLKQHCAKTFDRLCLTKKQELKDLVMKCEMLKIENKGKKIEACDDVLSIYCYVYNDLTVCFGNYEKYVPGKKILSTTRSTSTQSSKRISINIVTQSFSTTKPTTTTTKSTTKSTTTTTRPAPVTTKATSKASTRVTAGGNDLVSPFDGPVTSIPNDADKLKKIGNYCLRLKTKDLNCDKMLGLLKEKFKICEKKPKTDSDCQIFKIQFCSAFNNFPCCPDVLAGRQCNGKSNTMQRSLLYL